MPATSSIPVKRPVPAPATPWLLRHWQQVLLALAVGATAAVLASVVENQLQKARERSWEQLSYALANASQGNRAEALKTLDALLDSQRSGPLAVQAFMMKSDLLSADGKKDEALAAAKEAVRQAASPEYKALASIRLAWALEESGKAAEASAEYAQFIKTFPDHFLTGRAYAQMGRLQLLQGRWTEAKSTFEKVVTLYPSTIWAQEAKASLEEIKKQVPSK